VGLDADADRAPEHLELREVPVVARWWCRWWDPALWWGREEVWPRRLHAVAGGNAGDDLERWRVIRSDTAVFPEVVAVADALLVEHRSGRLRGRARRVPRLSADTVADLLREESSRTVSRYIRPRCTELHLPLV
jgi:hypothetical protein